MKDEGFVKKNFWQTLPGIFTAAAGIISAITGLLLAFNQIGCFNKYSKGTQTENVFSSKKVDVKIDNNAATKIDKSQISERPAKDALKPWSESKAVITVDDGSIIELRAESLCNCISVDHSLYLSSGQEIPFEKMQKFEVLQADMIGAPVAKANVLITLLDGTTINENVAANCDIFGYNDLGRFTITFQKLKQIAFRR